MVAILTLALLITIFIFIMMHGAAQTIVLNKSRESIIVGGEKDVVDLYSRILQTNGNDIKAGDLVTTTGESEATDDADLLGSGEPLAGIVLDYAVEADKKASYSLGVTIADNKKITVLRRTGGRMIIQTVIFRNTTVSGLIEIGAPIFASITTPGIATDIKPATANIEMMRFVGYAEDRVAAAETENQVIRVRY